MYIENINFQGMLSVDQSSESEDEDELHYDMEEDAHKYGWHLLPFHYPDLKLMHIET